jgi:hypothetical protein
MKPVGIVVDPAPGNDVRRLVALGSTVTHAEPVETMVRILRALDALDVSSARILPDPTGLALQALSGLQGELALLDAAPLALPDLTGTRLDAERAAAAMRDLDFGCIVVLGGGGTCRAVAAHCGEVPLIPLSTGAGSAFPGPVDGTLAGLAAAVCAAGALDDGLAVQRVPRLVLLRDGERTSDALVDIAVIDAPDTGAIRDLGAITEMYLAQARPGAIGLSAIGAALRRVPAGQGLHIRFAPSGGSASLDVLAPLAPGLVGTMSIAEVEAMRPGSPIDILSSRGVLALDGECEQRLGPPSRWSVVLDPQGPRIVDVLKALDESSARGFFRRESGLPATLHSSGGAPAVALPQTKMSRR